MAERSRPRGILRVILRVPVAFYRIGLAGMVGKTVLLLTTHGRRSGRARTTGLNYAQDGRVVYVASGFGERTDWYRNLLADPHVEVRVGRKHWRALAAKVTDPTERERVIALLRASAERQGPPRALRPLLARLGMDYDDVLRNFEERTRKAPLVALSPA